MLYKHEDFEEHLYTSAIMYSGIQWRTGVKLPMCADTMYQHICLYLSGTTRHVRMRAVIIR